MRLLTCGGLRSALLAALVTCTMGACGQNDDPATPDMWRSDIAPRPDTRPGMGKKGGPCYPNNTCNAGLRCQKGTCVTIPPDVGLPDRPIPPDQRIIPDLPAGGCPPLGYLAPKLHNDTAGDWTLALDPAFVYHKLTVASAAAKQAAAVMDFNSAWQQVAGFVVSRPSSNPIQGETADLVKIMQTKVSSQVTIDDTGTPMQSHDGFSATLVSTLHFSTNSSSDISLVRQALVAGLLGRSTAQLSGWSKAFGSAGTRFVLRYGAVKRNDGRVVFVGGITDEASDKDLAKVSHQLTLDLASASSLARASRGSSLRCDTKTITLPAKPVDFIWVVDESGSMGTKRANIAANAKIFFQQAQAAGLDFRMGITGVCHPAGPYRHTVGRFCSRATSNTADTGGTDRFLLPSEQALFSACINNPPGRETANEYGLFNAQAAVAQHLPRATNSSNRIRKSAQVVIIVVSDEVPASMLNTIGSSNLRKCPLDTTTQNKLTTALNPYVGYFMGISNTEAIVDYFQVIGGVCNNSCSAHVSHGYRELAKQFKGKVYDVCQANLTGSIQQIINEVKASGQPLTLATTPVSMTLRVSLDGKTVPRSRQTGFSFLHTTNGLAFNGSVQATKGKTLRLSYSTWK